MMGEKVGDELIEIEAKVEHSTAKAWLLEDANTGKQVWLPKSVGNIIRERDEDGNVLFTVATWWARKNGIPV